MKRFLSQIDIFLNEFDVNVKNRTHIKKISRIISELKNDINDSNDNFKNNNFKNDNFKNDDVENNNVRDNNIENDKIENIKKDEILNYIFQSLNKKIVAKFFINITSPKFAQIRFRNLVRCITQTYDKKMIHNVLIQLLCVRLCERLDHRFKCDQFKKIKLK